MARHSLQEWDNVNREDNDYLHSKPSHSLIEESPVRGLVSDVLSPGQWDTVEQLQDSFERLQLKLVKVSGDQGVRDGLALIRDALDSLGPQSSPLDLNPPRNKLRRMLKQLKNPEISVGAFVASDESIKKLVRDVAALYLQL